MPLDEREQRILSEIERRFYEEDPDLVDTVRSIEKTAGSKLPIRTIEELKVEAEKICGEPEPVELGEKVIAAIKWVDGTVIDVVYQVIEEE